MRGKHGSRFYCGFHGKKWAWQGKQLGLAGLNNFSGLYAIVVVPSCLVPSPGWSEQRNIASWVAGIRGGVVQTGLFGYQKYARPSVVFKNWLQRKEQSLPSQQGFFVVVF